MPMVPKSTVESMPATPMTGGMTIFASSALSSANDVSSASLVGLPLRMITIVPVSVV